MKNGLYFLLPALSALLCAFALTDFNYGILPWFSLAPFLFALGRAGMARGALNGFIFGYVYGLITFYWLPLTEGVGYFPFLLLIVPTFGGFYLLYGMFYSHIRSVLGRWTIVLAPALWVSMEYARANFFFLALPWNFLSHSQIHFTTLIQTADITGVYGISFLLVMVNQCLCRLFEVSRFPAAGSRHVPERRSAIWLDFSLVIAVVSIAVVFSYGYYRRKVPDCDRKIRVALVQANLIVADSMSRNEKEAHLQAYRRLSVKAAASKPDLIIWPSSSLPDRIYRNPVREAVQAIARETGAYLLVGGMGFEKLKPKEGDQLSYSNSEFLYTPEGSVKAKYDKIRLVPFDEYLPLENLVKWPAFITKMQTGFKHGEDYTLFEVDGAQFGTPICWESLFPDLFREFVKRGADFMVNVTNEGYTGRTSAPYQTLAMNVFRAVENRRVLLRAATTGVSCCIAPNGDIVKSIQNEQGEDRFVSGVLVSEVPLYSEKTFYMKYGDMFTYACIGFTVASLLYTLWRRQILATGIKSRDQRKI